VIEGNPTFPQDIIESLEIHAGKAERRAERTLFDGVDWSKIVGSTREPSIGDWVRMLHAVLRRKARLDAAGEAPAPVTNDDFAREVSRLQQAHTRVHLDGGNYL
jgi:hypothetical protein